MHAHLTKNQGQHCLTLVIECPLLFQARFRSQTRRGRSDTTTPVTDTVSFYYTDDFAAVTTDPEAEINQLVANANAGYMNSKLPIKLEVFCIKEIQFMEQGRISHIFFANLVIAIHMIGE